jgi:hypothetical protein
MVSTIRRPNSRPGDLQPLQARSGHSDAGFIFARSPPVAPPVCYASGMKKFIDYLRAAFIPQPPVGGKGVAFLTRACRWWLEFTRNLLVVAGFFFVAQASNSLVLKIFAFVSVGALFGMVMLFFYSWHLRLFPYIKSRRLYSGVNETLWGLILATLLFGSAYAVTEVLRALKTIAKV